MKTRLSSLVIALCLVLSMAVTAFAAPLTDIENHWAKEQIKTWEEKGLVKGYEDGTFRPDNNVSRAEFMALVNRAFNYQEKAEIDYKDVKEDAWYADVIKIAKAAGYISGYEDGTMRPNNPISRQEAAIIIMKILGLEENAAGADKFQDASSIPAWSKGAVGAVASSGIMGGYPDGTFRAVNLIKRAEAVVALEKALSSKAGVIKTDVTYDKAGTYGPVTGSEVIDRNVVITAANVTLQNTIIEGDLTIDEAVGAGDVNLKKVTVKGDTYIYGGGKDSIYFIDSQTGRTFVLKDDGPVRIVISGTTAIEELIAQSGVTVEEVDLSGEGVEGITVDKKVDGDIEINLRGVNLENLEINTPVVSVNTDKNTTINYLTANAKAEFRGPGTIKNAVINADGVTFEKMPEKQEVNKGVTPPTVAKSGGGGGGGGSSKEEVSAISVEGVAKVGETLTAKVTPTGATVNYQWQASADDGTTWDDIADATSKTYILSENEVGKLIRVKVTGTGNYTGTKISEAVGPVTAGEEPEPVASTYKFSYEVPDKVIAGESYTVPVTIEPETEGTVGYERVRFDVEVTTPDGATLQLLAEDTNGVVHDVAQIGYWGPENGFPIDANYSATTEFTAIFSTPGTYTITFSLVDLDAGEAQVTETVTIEVIGAVGPVEALITDLPEVPDDPAPELSDFSKPKPDGEKLTAIYNYLAYLENAEAVAAAKEAFDALDPSDQAKVERGTKAKLDAAVAKISELKAFVIDNTTIGVGTYKEDYSGLTEGAKGRIMVSVQWPFRVADGFNTEEGLTSIEEYLYNDERGELVRNVAVLDKMNPSTTGNWPCNLSGSFDLGVQRISSSGSWNNGLYELSGDEVTQADLPDKVVVEFTYRYAAVYFG